MWPWWVQQQGRTTRFEALVERRFQNIKQICAIEITQCVCRQVILFKHEPPKAGKGVRQLCPWRIALSILLLTHLPFLFCVFVNNCVALESDKTFYFRMIHKFIPFRSLPISFSHYIIPHCGSNCRLSLLLQQTFHRSSSASHPILSAHWQPSPALYRKLILDDPQSVDLGGALVCWSRNNMGKELC